jgi:hypothetical protein
LKGILEVFVAKLKRRNEVGFDKEVTAVLQVEIIL